MSLANVPRGTLWGCILLGFLCVLILGAGASLTVTVWWRQSTARSSDQAPKPVHSLPQGHSKESPKRVTTITGIVLHGGTDVDTVWAMLKGNPLPAKQVHCLELSWKGHKAICFFQNTFPGLFGNGC